MIYDITLSIEYDFDTPSDQSRSLMRLTPLDVPGMQNVLSTGLTIDPVPTERRESRDFFGNGVTSAAWHDPLDRLIVTLRTRIDRMAAPQGLDISPNLIGLRAELEALRDISGQSPHHFTCPSRRAPEDGAIAAFARAQVTPDQSSLQIVQSIGRALNDYMTFDAEATNVDTPAATAFENRHGVCQDFSHIMISALRSVGIPAGYVSGFLRTDPPPGQPRLEGADAMHAWVRAWVGGDMGWVEYDPTNACGAGLDHLVMGYGRDYDDVAPILGAMRAMGGHATRHAVDVVPATELATQTAANIGQPPAR